MHFLTNRNPFAHGVPNYPVIHSCLCSNAGRTNRPLVFGLRLLKAYDEGSKAEIETYRKALRKDVVEQAKKIHDKYIEVPKTTEFAMMFVPTESLYAEILRIPGVDEEIRQKYSISLSSPATLPVMLNGLLMGYRSVAIE